MMEKEENKTNDLPEGWDSESFVDTIEDFKAERAKQIQANAYLSNGKYPIVDQGQELIAGWSNDESAIIKNGLPLIIFGDHTRIFKYIDFPFAIGADGTKLIKPQSRFDARYFYYYLLILDIQSKGYSRHYKILKENNVNYPSLPEQKKISAILYKIQQAIETQDEIIKKTKELKKSTMQFLFTRGIYGEKTKQTEIGEMPEGWEVSQIKEVIVKTEQINPLQLLVEKFEYIDVSSVSRESLAIEKTTTTLKTNAPGRARKLVKTGDVIVATVRPTLKRLAFIGKEYNNQICSTAFCVLRSNPKFIVDKFMFYTIQQPYVYKILETMQGGASYPAVTDKNIYSLLIARPQKEEQLGISKILSDIDQKIELAERKKQTLNNLFQSMLNKLMTGAIRI